MLFHELFDKYKNLKPEEILLTVGQLDLSTPEKVKLISFIEMHQNIELNGDGFEESIAHVAGQTINNLNENEWVGKTVGKYRIDSVINSGASGAVFLGKRIGDFDQNVAVKLINPSVTEMIGEQNVLNEANLMASLNHVGIAKIFDSGRVEGGIIYFIIEHIEGKSLSSLIQSTLTINQSIDIAIKICSAISHAHENQIFHKDIKPDNILIDKDGEVKIIDFGLSQNNKAKINGSNFFAMSKDYASPEQLEKHPLSTRTDIFSIGCVVFELVFGSRYFTTSDKSSAVNAERTDVGKISEFILKHSVNTKKFTSKLSSLELAAILEKALQKDPVNRYKTADAFAHDLERFKKAFPVKAYQPKTLITYKSLLFTKRNPLIVFLGLVIFSSSIWYSLETKNQLVSLRVEQANVNQVLSRIKQLLIHADPRERLGNPISFKDVLVRELNAILDDSKENLTDPVKYEILMTIGKGLLGHGKGVEASVAYKFALDIATRHYGKDSIQLASVTVELVKTYTQNVHYEETSALIEPFIDKLFALEFEHIDYARMFVEFNKLNSRFFVDNYKDKRKEKAIQTLRRISKRYYNELSPIEIIDLEFSIITSSFYDYIGDYASPTAHINEEIVIERIGVFKKMIPNIDNLIDIARNNKNTKFLLPNLLVWKARLHYEVKDYAQSQVSYSEGLKYAELYFEEADHRLSSAYLIGSAIYRFIDPEKASDLAEHSLSVANKSLNNDISEYLDNMNFLIDFYYLAGDFINAERSVKEALAILDDIDMTEENKESIASLSESYTQFHHSYEFVLSDLKNKELYHTNYNCDPESNRAVLFCEILQYIHSGGDSGELIHEKVTALINDKSYAFLGNHSVLTIIIVNLNSLGLHSQSLMLVNMLESTLDWSLLEKERSMEYASYQLVIANVYYKVGDLYNAKIKFMLAEAIFLKHYREDNGFVAIIYTGLAEIAYDEQDFEKVALYLDQLQVSFKKHFTEAGPLGSRISVLSNKLALLL